ncbi:NADPH:quinone oxidoreductase family protein [Agrobacterium sp.]|uniref:NADPH:quinone oxidoreductase family protein n=1 Tax=Agrobacterium sp. TaxID=361 RepID=UPI0028AA4848|nr:NADPH:quinone oxidoreductase family protein [Agrobacterium sp.]
MLAYELAAYGPPLSHQLGEVAEPQVAAGQVLIAVEAIGLNFPDALMVQGKYQKRPQTPFVAGRDCAGTVTAIGAGVTAFKPGDKVVAQVFSGAFAEKVAAPVDRVFLRPDGVSARDAAGAVTVFNTAFVAVAIRAEVKAGDRVIVTGAAGGVGAAAVQLAVNLGADVVGIVSSEAKAELVRRAGARAIVIAERDPDLLKQAFKTQVRQAWGDDRGGNVAIDTVGGATFDAALRALGFAGKLVVVGFASGDIPAAKANYLLYNNLTVMGAPLDIHFDEALERIRAGTSYWLDLLSQDKVQANVSTILPFDQLMQGLQDILDRKVTGKIVVTVGAAA